MTKEGDFEAGDVVAIPSAHQEMTVAGPTVGGVTPIIWFSPTGELHRANAPRAALILKTNSRSSDQ
jgi:hypothetical protein